MSKTNTKTIFLMFLKWLSYIETLCSLKLVLYINQPEIISRKNGTLRRRYKQYTDELYTEHPKDIVEALKRNRQLIRKHRQNRSTKVAEAIKVSNVIQLVRQILLHRQQA